MRKCLFGFCVLPGHAVHGLRDEIHDQVQIGFVRLQVVRVGVRASSSEAAPMRNERNSRPDRQTTKRFYRSYFYLLTSLDLFKISSQDRISYTAFYARRHPSSSSSRIISSSHHLYVPHAAPPPTVLPDRDARPHPHSRARPGARVRRVSRLRTAHSTRSSRPVHRRERERRSERAYKHPKRREHRRPLPRPIFTHMQGARCTAARTR